MNFVILDIETTGLDIENNSIIEVGAILVSNNKIKEEFSSFVNYSGELSETIKRLTGINEEMLSDAPEIDQVIVNLKKFIKNYPVVAHNGFVFDFPILERVGLKIADKHDSMEFAFFVMPISEFGHSVSAMAKFFSLGEEKHRALEDCKMQLNIILNLDSRFIGRAEEKRESLKYLAQKIDWWWHSFLPGKAQSIQKISSLVEKYQSYRKENNNQEVLGLINGPIDDNDIEECFSIKEGGHFDYSEDRPEQKKMAHAVANALNNSLCCVIEAGTGTGKSKAYLVPSVLFAKKNNVPIIISTHTKALQDQLYLKEINHLREKIGQELRVAVIKGKSNYVCLDKFDEFFNETINSLSQRSLYEFGALGVEFTSRIACLLLSSWIVETERGDWDEVPFWLKIKFPKKIEKDICNVDELCAKNICNGYDDEKCFLAKARLRARDSDIVIANHSVVLTDFTGNLFPPEARYLIIDEAHHLEDSATSAWERIISDSIMERVIFRLFSAKGIVRIMDAIVKQNRDEQSSIFLNKFRSLQGDTVLLTRSLFDSILPQIVNLPKNEPSKYNTYVLFSDLLRDKDNITLLISSLENIRSRFVESKGIMSSFQEYTDNTSQKYRLRVSIDQLDRIIDSLNVVINNDDNNFVRYLEVSDKQIEIKVAPVSVAEYLEKFLLNQNQSQYSSVVFTSATLSVNKKFDFFADRCGISLADQNRVKYLLLPSSFNYEKQVKFFIPRGITYKDKEKHFKDSINFLKDIIVASNGGVLILCTSHDQVEKIYNLLLPQLSKSNIWLLKQQRRASSNSIIRDFAKDINSVLIGTSSLWQGIDVPGDSLRTLVIYKIPYKMLGNPVLDARCKMLDSLGVNSFKNYYEPLAAIELKQGFGRLIRKKTDSGIAVILEEGIVNKKSLLNSFPDGVRPIIMDCEEIIATVKGQKRV